MEPAFQLVGGDSGHTDTQRGLNCEEPTTCVSYNREGVAKNVQLFGGGPTVFDRSVPPDEMREYNIQLAQSLMAWAYDFKTRYHQTWSFQLVEKRIQVIRDALALMAGELPNPPTVMERIPDQEFATVVTGWVELASALDDRYKHIGQLQDLEEQICILLRTLGAVSDDPKKAILTKRELGAALRTRFDHLGNITDIQDALVLHSSLLDQVNAGQLGYHWLLYELGCTLYNRFTRFGDDDDLTRCVAMQTEAIEIFPASDPWRFLPQRILAAALWTSYRRSGELSYLNNASSLLLDILHTQPSNHRDRYQTYHTLSSCKESLFRQCGDMADLDEAIACSRQALSLQDSRHPARLRSLNNLAGMLRSRHFYLGAIADVEESITLLRQGLGLPGQGDERASALYQLATGYKGRYEALGQLDDLDESIRLLREALDLRPSGHPGRAPILNGLGRAVQMRYRIYRRVDDSVEAIHLYRSALGLYSRNNTNYVGTVFNLVEALSESYGGYHQEDCLEEAIVLCETWLAGSQDEERSLRGWFLHTFAKALSLRYERHHCTEDLTTAILRCKDALFFLPAGYMIHRCYSFVQLADMLRRQYEITHAPEDARRAAKSLTDALACLPEGHPERATALFEFARLRLVPESPVFDKSSALEMLARAVSDGRQNAQTRLASALDVLKHVERHVSVSQPDPQLQQALLDVYTRTVELLPRVAYFGLDVESRLRALANSDKVAADGAAHALLLAQPEFAIELLELGRAVFWSQQLRLRTAFSALPSELAAKLTQAAFMLERGSHCAGHTVNENQAKAAQEIQTANRRRLGDDFEELIAQARALPGFERFMLPEPFRALCTAAAHGPVVVLLANDIACQAIVLETPESVHQVQLPKAYLKTLKTLSRAMSIAVRRGRGLLRNRAMKKLHVEGGRKAEQVLEELWRNVILRVINVLDARRAQRRSRPRIALCPIGIFAHLPIHAAGVYRTSDTEAAECLSDYYVSSYTPTIGALLNARRRASGIPVVEAKILLAAVSQPFQWAPLHFVANEIESIRAVIPPHVPVDLLGDADRLEVKFDATPTTEAILQKLPGAAILHLACHGLQNRQNPLDSGFVMRDSMLTVAKLMALHLNKAFLAFLSACETAKGDESQPDQAIHLAATMLFAGFRSVVGTMWSMDDIDGPIVAKTVYEELYRPGADVLDPNAVPYALDLAVRKLRAQGLSASRWAPYVHLGA